MALRKGFEYGAVIRTSCGDFKLDLDRKRAPVAVNNFVFLARQGFYDGLTFHQVIPSSLIQAGDPNGLNGRAPDGPGYTIPDELPKKPGAYRYGVMGMANTGAPDSAGSQFFIVVHDVAGALEGEAAVFDIDPAYTVFGEVRRPFYGSLENIARQETNGVGDQLTASMPKNPIYIESVEIVESKR
jgi:peptidylprolyl isomerase